MIRIPLRALLVLSVLVPWMAGCEDDPVAPETARRTVGVVVESTDLSLTVFDMEDPTSTTSIGLGPAGTPVSLAVQGGLAAVPLGIVPAVAVVDLEAGEVLRTVALPEGSGATGALFVNDSIVLVGNPARGSLSPVNVRAGTAGEEIEVGRYPHAFVASSSRIYVLDSELEAFVPVGPSTVKVLDRATLAVVDTIALSGVNASDGVLTDGALWVINSGHYGSGDGTLSKVDLGAAAEEAHFEGFGEFPGSLARGGDGLFRTASYELGVLVWDPGSETFVRGPDDPVAPGGIPATAAVATDPEGWIWALLPHCADPTEVHRLGDQHETLTAVPVGSCPSAIAFTELEGGR